MKSVRYLLLCAATLGLAACQTADGLVADVSEAFSLNGGSSPYATSEVELAKSNDPCPQVQIVDELSSFSEFDSPDATSEERLVSRVTLNQVESSCTIQGDQAIVDLKLAFLGSLGPKAKKNSNDKPFFSYPFFVAVTDPKGIIMAKEVFGASMTYERDEKTHDYFENLRQIIPVRTQDSAKRYKVLLGFQLDAKQLKYNRKYMVPVASSE